MQHAQNSTTNTTTPTSLDWPPAIWFSTMFGRIDSSEKQALGQGKSATTPVEGVLKDMAQSATPWVQALTQANAEVASLLTRRAQALSELSTKAIECRQPQDVLALQTQFWASAYQQHTEATKRIVAAWGTVMPMAEAIAGSIGQTMLSEPAAQTSGRTDTAAAPDEKVLQETNGPVAITPSVSTPGSSGLSQSAKNDRRSAA